MTCYKKVHEQKMYEKKGGEKIRKRDKAFLLLFQLVPGNHSEATTLEIIKEKTPKEQVVRRQKLSGSQYRSNKNHAVLRPVKSATLAVNYNDTSETITPDEDKKFQVCLVLS